MFFFSSRRRHTRLQGDWSSDVCSSDLQSVLLLFRTLTLAWPDGAAACGMRRQGAGSPVMPVATMPFDTAHTSFLLPLAMFSFVSSVTPGRSEERRVGKECRSRWSPYH